MQREALYVVIVKAPKPMENAWRLQVKVFPYLTPGQDIPSSFSNGISIGMGRDVSANPMEPIISNILIVNMIR